MFDRGRRGAEDECVGSGSICREPWHASMAGGHPLVQEILLLSQNKNPPRRPCAGRPVHRTRAEASPHRQQKSAADSYHLIPVATQS